VPDAAVFRSGRQFAAWLGLTPRAHSSGGKERLGGISKQGDSSIRRLLSSARPPSSALPDRTMPARLGQPGCSNASRQEWCRWPSPTRRLVSPGRSSHTINPARCGLVAAYLSVGFNRSTRGNARVVRRDDEPVAPGTG
jgi:hypothetical protein